ncbi:MAG: metal-dependent hydrolase [Anaerolineales bacterium]|nr:metal-dependent hydrolase [Anaerolineales bacterium]
MTIKLTWHGHAAMLLEAGGARLLVDPFLTGNPAATLTAEAAAADYILISHGHGDHVGDAVSIAQRTGATVIANFEICNWFNSQGVANTHAQHLGGGHQYPFGYLKLTLALHGSALPDGTYGGNPCGFLLSAEGKKVYLACDTGLFGDMRLIGEEGLDLAVLPIGDNFTMGPDDALRAAKFLQARHLVPVHYNTWGLIAQDGAAWAARVAAEAGSQVHVLKPGESLSL